MCDIRCGVRVMTGMADLLLLLCESSPAHTLRNFHLAMHCQYLGNLHKSEVAFSCHSPRSRG